MGELDTKEDGGDQEDECQGKQDPATCCGLTSGQGHSQEISFAGAILVWSGWKREKGETWLLLGALGCGMLGHQLVTLAGLLDAL